MASRRTSKKGSFTGQVWKFIFVLVFGVMALEAMLEFGFSTSLLGASKGLFIETASGDRHQAKIVDTPLRQRMRVVNNTSLRARPHLKSEKVSILKTGMSLKVIAKTTVDDVDVWYQTLRFGGKIGYVHGPDVRRK
ncbi:MAG: SH3 domain-containing protein [Alphaproteobacteria bacterium]